MPLLFDHDLRTLSAAPAGLTFARESSATRIGPTGLIETVPAGTPRLQYDPATGAPLGWLIEDAAANLLANPEDFASGWTIVSATVQANAASAPDGTPSADRMLETAATDQHAISQTLSKAAASLAYTGSIFVKASGRSEVQLSLRAGSVGTRFNFDLANPGVILAQAYGSGWTAISASIRAFPGDWYRLSATVLSDATTQIRFLVRPLSNGLDTYAGDPTKGLLYWGANLIQADSESSYTPGARAADFLSATATLGQGTTLLRGRLRQASPALYAQADAGTDADAVQIGWDTAPYVRALAGGVERARLTPGVLGATERLSLATSWGDGTLRASLNGNPTASVPATLATFASLRLARQAGRGGPPAVIERVALRDDAQNAAGLEALASLLPQAPTGLRAVRTGPTSAQLTWTNPPGVLTAIELAHAADAGFANAVTVGGLPPDMQSLQISDLPAANVRAFQVRAINEEGVGAWSAAAVLIDGVRRVSPPADARRTLVRSG